jgi:TolB-like protein
LLIQIVATIEEPLGLPPWFDTAVIILLAIGLPITLVISWAFDVTPAGLVRDTRAAASTSGQPRTLEYTLIGLLALAVIYLFVDDFLLDRRGDDAGLTALEPANGGIENLPKVAVLPCGNLSPREEDAYFSAGVHDEILNQLVKLSGLLVASRTSVLQYANGRPAIPQIAAELGVQAVMECSVRFAGTSVLVTAQLIDSATDTHIFSETYPADLSDLSSIFAIQADIAMNIANALRASYSEDERTRIEHVPTTDAEAYALYLQAGNAATPAAALALLDRAINADPDFALAHAEKARTIALSLRDTVNTMASRDDPAELADMAIDAASRALDLDPDIGRAHSALAEVHLQFWRWPEARSQFAEALRLDPNDVNLLRRYGWFSIYIGEYEQARRYAQRMSGLSDGGFGRFNIGYAHLAEGNVEAAAEVFRELANFAPGQLPSQLTQFFLANAELRLGNYGEAIEALELAEALYGDNFPPLAIAEIAHSYSQTSRKSSAVSVRSTEARPTPSDTPQYRRARRPSPRSCETAPSSESPRAPSSGRIPV